MAEHPIAASAGTGPAPFRLDRRALVRAFSRAGPHYRAAATFQREVGAELLERLQFFDLQPRCVLDLGSGPCWAAPLLRGRFARARIIAVDIAEGMLRAAGRPSWRWRPLGFERLCADAVALPLAAGSVDLVYSNLMLQWCDRPERVFAEVARVLRPGGLLLFSSFGPDTLIELREAWGEADPRAHVSRFADLRELGDGLLAAGLAEPVVDQDRRQRHYPNLPALMQELKRLGATNADATRTRGLTSPRALQRVVQTYEARRTGRGLPATFELLCGAAFGATAGARPDARAAGEVRVALETLRRGRS